MKLLLFCCLSFTWLLMTCQVSQDPGKAVPPEPGPSSGFSMEDHGTFQLLKIRNPWQGAEGIRFRYVLSNDPGSIPDSLHELPKITTPVRRVICMSTTHVAMIEALGESRSIVGISGGDYIRNPVIKAGLQAGRIHDIGADQSLNLERILLLNPDVMIMFSIAGNMQQLSARLGRQGIPVLVNADYLESTPLGKTDWLRCMAALYEKEHMADTMLERIERQYRALKKMAAGAKPGPRVMTGLPWKEVWYIPGNHSFAAAFLRDAGASYLWNDLEGREARPMNLEAVFHRAQRADVWVNAGAARSLADITLVDERLRQLPPCRSGRVYNNTARINAQGGNDFWETGVMEPHLILADLISIFHPDLLPDHQLKYYERLK